MVDFGYDYELVFANSEVALGPRNVSNVAPSLGQYEMYFSTYVLSGTAFNINLTCNFDSGYFYLLGYCDTNKDNVVDAKDYQQVKRSGGAMPGGPKWRWSADVNCNGAVTVTDWVLVKGRLPLIYTPT
jgi:hypothetical protein